MIRLKLSSAVKRRIFVAAWLLALAVAASIPALAIVRGSVWIGPGTYRSHGTLRHPLLAIGGEVWLPRGSKAMVVSILGSVHVQSAARDDIAAVGAPVYLGRGSTVDRDVISIGSSVYRGPHVRVRGRIGGDMVSWSGHGAPGATNWLAATWHSSGLSFAAGFALLLICTFIAMAFPWPVVLVATHLQRELPRSIVAGLMGAFLFIFLVVPLGLSLFGLPFAVLLAVVAVGAWLLGLCSFGLMVGRHLASARGHDAGMLWAVVAGMFVVAVAGGIPWVGSLVLGLCGATGAGALALTMISRARPVVPSLTLGGRETLHGPGAYIEREAIPGPGPKT